MSWHRYCSKQYTGKEGNLSECICSIEKRFELHMTGIRSICEGPVNKKCGHVIVPSLSRWEALFYRACRVRFL